MIGGRVVVENRRPVGVDLSGLRVRADAARERLTALNADNRRLYDALEPIVGSYCPGLARMPYHVHATERGRNSYLAGVSLSATGGSRSTG